MPGEGSLESWEASEQARAASEQRERQRRNLERSLEALRSKINSTQDPVEKQQWIRRYQDLESRYNALGAEDEADPPEEDTAKRKQGFADFLKNSKRKVQKDYGNSRTKRALGSAMQGSAAKWIFWLAIAVHALDAWQEFQRTEFLYRNMMMLYLVVTVLAYFFVFRKEGAFEGIRHWFIFLGLAAIYFFLPFLRGYFPTAFTVFGIDFGTILNLIIIFVPLWPIYIAKHFGYDQGIRILAVVWALLLIFLVSYYAFFVDRGDLPFQEGELATHYPIQKLMDIVGNGAKNLWSGITAPFVVVKSSFNESMHRVTDPYYSGRVETNKYADLGVKLSDVEPLYSRFEPGDPIIVYADIAANSFDNIVTVHNGCVLENGPNTIKGTMTPDQVDLGYGEQVPLECRIENTHVNYSYRSSRVLLDAVFTFQTWGYVTHSFMDVDTLRQLKRTIDVNAELKLDKYPKAVYTGGPVSLGLVEKTPAEEPLAVSVENDRLPFFGVTIQNKELEGTVNRIRKVVLHVPKPLLLDQDTCSTPYAGMNIPAAYDEDIPEKDAFAQQYNSYVFEDLDKPGMDYLTIRCRLALPPGDGAMMDFLGEGNVAVYTFYATAEYDYTLTKKVPISLIPVG